MKITVFVGSMLIMLSSAVTAMGEEIPVICKLREDLNFKRPAQVIYLRIDMQNKTVSNIPATVIGNDIITYETEKESLTFIMPSMNITLIRKGKGADNSDVHFSGVCNHDRLIF